MLKQEKTQLHTGLGIRNLFTEVSGNAVIILKEQTHSGMVRFL